MATPDVTLARTTSWRIPVGGASLDADLIAPVQPMGLVLFAHGSGSSRQSPRNRQVAAALQRRGLACLLADLLTVAEERLDVRTSQYRFDIPRLARRLSALVDWAATRDDLAPLPVGLFGASTGAAAALDAAAQRPGLVDAVVSRGGRPDLAKQVRAVHAPTLLIVGEADQQVLQLNRAALSQLACAKQLQVIPRATHLFEEPGALEAVASAAGAWFQRYLDGER
jgi:dienelactone hydrolase